MKTQADMQIGTERISQGHSSRSRTTGNQWLLKEGEVVFSRDMIHDRSSNLKGAVASYKYIHMETTAGNSFLPIVSWVLGCGFSV